MVLASPKTLRYHRELVDVLRSRHRQIAANWVAACTSSAELRAVAKMFDDDYTRPNAAPAIRYLADIYEGWERGQGLDASADAVKGYWEALNSLHVPHPLRSGLIELHRRLVERRTRPTEPDQDAGSYDSGA